MLPSDVPGVVTPEERDEKIAATHARIQALREKHRHAHKWLDAPAHDGPWWRVWRNGSDEAPSLVSVSGVDDPDGDGVLRVYHFGVEWAEYLDAPGCERVADFCWYAMLAPSTAVPTPPAPDHAEAAAEIAALLDADDASPEGVVYVEAAADTPQPPAAEVLPRRWYAHSEEGRRGDFAQHSVCSGEDGHTAARDGDGPHGCVAMAYGRDEADAAAIAQRIADDHNEVVRLRADLAALACAVRREHNTRLAWLATLPDGTCPSPPPQALLDAEAATREALRRVA